MRLISVSTNKRKVVIVNGKGDIYLNGERLEEVNSFKYLSDSKDGSSTTDIRLRIVTDAAAMVWVDRV